MADSLHMLWAFLRHQLLARNNGHGIHSPFVYQLCENVFYARDSFYDFERLGKIKENLLLDRTELETGDFGAGSRSFKTSRRRVNEIARRGITPQRQSEILFRLANFLGIQTSVELGTSIGMNTLYLAQQNPAGKVITLEGSPALSRFAQRLAKGAGVGNIRFVTGKFEEVLPDAVKNIGAPAMIYVDGDHRYSATMQIFETLSALKCVYNVFVFDDIYWSRQMTKAWKEICADSNVTLAIDAFYCGFIFFRPEIKEKLYCRLKM